jgi:aldehyde:ferredoxin oxidoreductase
MYGYAGKILRVNLTTREIITIPTSDYEKWGGGHGIGSALFFDLVTDKTITAFDPANVVTIMSSPLSGTMAPGCSSRTEVQGIGAQPYPKEWFTRSGFGGRFSSMIKFAGWDGIAVEGAASTPVWIDIRDGEVTIRECSELSLWGRDAWETQNTICDYIAGTGSYSSWVSPDSESDARSTQRPAVLAIGPAGENLSRLAVLQHGASNTSGQGGLGAVWGSKKLKAISVMGTGSIPIADPKALVRARLEQVSQYGFNYDNPREALSPNLFQSPPGQATTWDTLPVFTHKDGKRPQACIGCHSGCRRRYENGLGNEASCSETTFYFLYAKTADILYQATDLLNKYGVNCLEAYPLYSYLLQLNKEGILGPGKEIDCPLDFSTIGSLEFMDQFLRMIAYRDDGLGNEHEFGNIIAEGTLRAAEKWGRLEQDLKTGLLEYPYWGFWNHYDPRVQLEWGYGTILGDRDINEHDFMRMYIFVKEKFYAGVRQLTPEEVVTIVTDKMVPYQGDLLMLDFSTDNMYSEHIAKLVTWHRCYTRFWKQSMLLCDNRWPDFINSYSPDMIGSTGEAEPRFFNIVTGKNFTFLDGIELGRKIWNLDNAVWSLQGRHRDMVKFADYIYDIPGGNKEKNYLMKINGAWTATSIEPRIMDRQNFEEFKTVFYQLQGWDPATGYPTRATLETLGMGYVADELQKNGRLGQG